MLKNVVNRSTSRSGTYFNNKNQLSKYLSDPDFKQLDLFRL